MKIVVTIKRVIDPYIKIRVKADNSGVETKNIKMSMNPFDEIALEEAIRLKEQQNSNEIIAISIGSDANQETLRHALALGADRAILVRTEKNYCSLNVAKILEAVIKQERPDLVLMGKQAIDDDNNQTPQMLAGLLNWPQATFISKLMVEGQSVKLTREVDGGLEILAVTLPAVVSTDLRLNEPRYASLPNIMKAKRKPLVIIAVDSLNLELKDHLRIMGVYAPQQRVAGVKLSTVKELVDKLRNEAKVI